MDWFKKAFGPLYNALYSHRDERDARRAVDFVERRFAIDRSRDRILDLCCGAGRHSIEWLARAPLQITGLDLSKTLLVGAHRAAAQRRVDFPLVRGDMRHLPYVSETFALVICLFTSFGYFEDDAENERVLGEIARVLIPGAGRLVLDHINPAWLRKHLKPETRRSTSGGLVVRETRRIDIDNRRVVKTIEIVAGAEPDQWHESVRLYEPDEIASMACRHDLTIESSYGDFDDSPLSDKSHRAIYILRKIERTSP